MPLISQPADYTDKDMDSLRTRLFALVQSVFPEWTDRNVADFGNLLVELYAFVGDMLSFYQDNQAGESRITTATQRKSLIGLSKLLNFTPPGATAATADVVLTLSTVSPGDVELPEGTVVETADVTSPVQFQLLAPATILAGQTAVIVTVENSSPADDTFASTGLPNQEVALVATPYLDDSATVVAADGAYTQVDNFLSSTGTDKHFTVVVDQNDRARLRFGSGAAGSIPSGTIAVSYKTGGGSAGEVTRGTITVIQGSFTDVLSNAVQLFVTNPDRASGGTDRMSNASIKVRAPASIRAPVNSISREDFEINALRLGAVARALMLTSDEDAGIPENSGVLYIVPAGGGAPSSGLKLAVASQVTTAYPPPLTWTTLIEGALYKTVNVEARVSPRAGFSKPTLRINIVAALTAWFAIQNTDGSPNPNVNFGAKYLNADGVIDPNLPWSDLFNVVRDATGVRKLDPSSVGFLLNGVRADIALAPSQFPVLGSVTLIDADTAVAF